MQSNKICDYCKKDGNPDKWSDCLFCHADEVEFVGIEAIPVEQVAKMLLLVSDNSPCNFSFSIFKTVGDDFCAMGKCTRRNHLECWEHALKEGWLDE